MDLTPGQTVEPYEVERVLGAVLGTLRFMAPEQLRRAARVDHRADLFSLGCMLYEMTCGKPAFPADSLPDLILDLTTGSYPAPRARAPGLPDRLVHAIEGCLRVDPDERIADCQALLSVLSGGAPQAHADPVRYHLPEERDPFVGRAADIASLRDRLRGGARLVSVLGIGGGERRDSCSTIAGPTSRIGQAGCGSATCRRRGAPRASPTP